MGQKKLRFKKAGLMLFFQIIVLTSITAQEKKVCNGFVDLLIEVINNKSSNNLKSWLSENFSMLEQKGDIAVQVLNMLIVQVQLNDSILNYTETRNDTLNGVLTIEYDFEYKKKGHIETKIVFDDDNKVIEIKLIEAEVKLLDKSDKIVITNTTQQQIISIPIEIIDRLILVDVIVNGEKCKFVLDNGSSRTMLNSKYYSTVESSMSSSKGISGNSIHGMDIITLESLNFAGLQIVKEKVPCVNLNGIEENHKKVIHGIIGTDMIEQFDVMFDYKSNTITLIKPESFEFYIEKDNYYSIPFVSQKGHLPIVNLNVASNEYNVGVDCGATANVISTDYQDELGKSLKRVKKVKLKGFSQEKKTVTSCKLKNISIGDKTFKPVRTVFSDLSHLNKDIKIEGLIGYEMLSKQKSIISYARQELLLEK